MPKRKISSFEYLGINKKLADSCSKLKWTTATEIQQNVLPIILEGKDVIALAETGSGKTGAFCLPMLHMLMLKPWGHWGLIISPTRDLALQITETIDSLGKHLGVRCATLVGGCPLVSQIPAICSNPHIIVATPGRLLEHLEKCKGFNLTTIKYLVFDEADQLLNMGFEADIESILKCVAKQRQTLLFSATMTSKVRKLNRVHLKNPVNIEVSTKFKTVDTLEQFMLFIPFNYKKMYLVAILKKLEDCSVIIFTDARYVTLKICLMLNNLGMDSVALHGKMNQIKRNQVLEEFKEKKVDILVATDLCSRGLDIPDVNYVINFDLPKSSKGYIHRVGRTARAGRTGIAITMVSQYHVEQYLLMEKVLGKKFPVYEEVTREEALALSDDVTEADISAKMELKKRKKMKF